MGRRVSSRPDLETEADWEGKEQLPLKALEGVREEPALLNRKRAG